MTRAPIRALAALAFVTSGCTLSGTASIPTYVCAAVDNGGRRITCDAPGESYPGDGCRCVTRATGDRGPDVYFGRVATE
jgi:hypothetical protein